ITGAVTSAISTICLKLNSVGNENFLKFRHIVDIGIGGEDGTVFAEVRVSRLVLSGGRSESHFAEPVASRKSHRG
ncbi:hypothetical protein PENTCL1PPCAC_15094, partial [Pristionchus entomophagus]